MDNIWQLQIAKSKFSELVERALANGVQIITRRGHRAVVLLSYAEYQRLKGRSQDLVHFLLDSPLAGADLEIDHLPDMPRNVEIE